MSANIKGKSHATTRSSNDGGGNFMMCLLRSAVASLRVKFILEEEVERKEQGAIVGQLALRSKSLESPFIVGI
jgi:hypothetical protein